MHINDRIATNFMVMERVKDEAKQRGLAMDGTEVMLMTLATIIQIAFADLAISLKDRE